MKKLPSRFLLILAAALVLAGLAFLLTRENADPYALSSQGIEGPSEATPLPLPADQVARTEPSVYAQGGRNALVILLRDSTASWLGLVHGLKSHGIPVRVVTTVDEALTHRVVMVYPSLTGSNTPADLRDKLDDHVVRGGTLIGFSVVGGGLRGVFGYGASDEVRGLKSIRLAAIGEGAWKPERAEADVPLADIAEAAAGLPGVIYRDPVRAPLAVYDNGGPAIVGGSYGRGAAYAIGFDLGHYILRAYNGRFNVAAEAYANSHQPKVDGLLRLVGHWYLRGEPDAVTLAPAPEGRAFAALITHDVDYTGSMDNVEAYSADEESRGLRATYFIQAKYVTDYNDKKFFDVTRREILRRLPKRGMEVASHSVAHSSVFNEMPLGTGTEAYPDYQPFVKTFTSQRGGSVLGELRVSKYLLETLSATNVVSLRPGHLSLPPALPEALAATGYRFSSSMTAGQAKTHRPYRTMHGRSYGAESETYEFPVTIEDERWELGDNIDAGVALARAVGRHGGLVNVLVHTDELGGKLKFQQAFYEALKGEAWFGTLSEFGSWWAARDRVVIDVKTPGPGRRIVVVTTPLAVSGLTLDVPAGWSLTSRQSARQEGRRVVLTPLRAGARVALDFSSGP